MQHAAAGWAGESKFGVQCTGGSALLSGVAWNPERAREIEEQK
jgi:hypothetical protein